MWRVTSAKPKKIMNFPKKIVLDEDDPYNIGGYSSSDDGGNESSDDEFVTEGLLKDQKQEIGSSSEDEFEKEMDLELESVIKSYTGDHEDQGNQNANITAGKSVNDATSSNNNTQDGDAAEDNNTMYAEDYFSSGSDDEHRVGGQPSKSKERRKMLTNDELLYDPDMDDEDEQWVIRQRQDHRQRIQQRINTVRSTEENQEENQEESSASKKKTKKSKQNVEKVPSSDAILSCPACMTTLCIDCQRHDMYKNQYRAMFVMNCKVVKDEILRYEPSQQQKPGKKRKKAQKGKLVQLTKDSATSADSSLSECYHPVACTECNTEIAVYDGDEVYHFFNVLASHA